MHVIGFIKNIQHDGMAQNPGVHGKVIVSMHGSYENSFLFVPSDQMEKLEKYINARGNE